MNNLNKPAVAGALFTYAAILTALIWMATTCGCSGGCSNTSPITVSDAGVQRVHVIIPTGPDGTTVEQRNIRDRLLADNKAGALKHLYVISAYSGQVIIYSTVKGKVTSSGKRLTPYSVAATDGNGVATSLTGMPVTINGNIYSTPEVIQDDGTYGSSVEYVYWWDTNGRYHQHYNSGGQIIHTSDQPLPVKSITINMELAEGK